MTSLGQADLQKQRLQHSYQKAELLELWQLNFSRIISRN